MSIPLETLQRIANHLAGQIERDDALSDIDNHHEAAILQGVAQGVQGLVLLTRMANDHDHALLASPEASRRITRSILALEQLQDILRARPVTSSATEQALHQQHVHQEVMLALDRHLTEEDVDTLTTHVRHAPVSDLAELALKLQKHHQQAVEARGPAGR